MRWTRVLANTAVFAAGVAAVLLWQWPREPAPVATLQPTPANTLDLRDASIRLAFARLAGSPRAGGVDADYSLLHRCTPGMPDTYAVLKSWSFERNEYVELRRNQGDAGAIAWHWHGFRAGRAVPHAVGVDDIAAIEAEFLALTHARVEPIRSIEAFDGGSMTLEFCRGGQYGLFLRSNVFEDADDRRVLDLGYRLLALAGLPPD
ncbi:hypothetical protein [Tahibacter sp.]|uniref:hypothetical protein n=1 Tax=Tahibacter sp. TaxID=2056211 RepID=UPI0028C3D528|nr:hypothetical protein [Tahibacter sp.]